MNKVRRAALTRVAAKIEDLTAELESMAMEESDYFENMPESLQCSERGQHAEETAEALSDAANDLSEVSAAVRAVIES